MENAIYQFLFNMWIMNRIDEDHLQIMVEKKFITQEEMEMILATPKIR